MGDDTETPAGWTIVSIADDGSVLCQSPSGHRRRYWFQAAELNSLPDDDEPITQEWWEKHRLSGALSIARTGDWNLFLDDELEVVVAVEGGHQFWLPAVRTRGDVRQLVKLLGRLSG